MTHTKRVTAALALAGLTLALATAAHAATAQNEEHHVGGSVTDTLTDDTEWGAAVDNSRYIDAHFTFWRTTSDSAL
ncbi:hypothetical protein ACFQ7O_01230 [Streptomyces sp. NPDC056485]|uniref:hypothetical protein n=1 Tax=Streptomyces sp. NPDC056485 TaxID=3345834 RepID=UPI0036CC431C